MSRWRVGPGGALAFAAVAALGLTACSPANQGAVTLDAQMAKPALVLALCDGEEVLAVRLSVATTSRDGFPEVGDELWRIEAESNQRLTRFVLGEVPPGFVERKSLSPQLPPRMFFNAETKGGLGGSHGSSFERSELKAGVLVQGGQRVSEKGLRRSARENCTSNLFVLVGLPGWLGWLTVPTIALGLLLAVRTIRRRRRQPRAVSGGWPPPASP